MTRRSYRALTRHFIGAIVEPPILTDIGVDALRRTLITLLALFISVGLFLPRLFMSRYAALSHMAAPDAYVHALAGDTLFMLALPMYILGMAAVVVSPMLFPDETDYRVLTPLPLTRRELFAAKLSALVLVAVAAVLAVNSVASLSFPAVSGGRWATHQPLARVAAHAVTACVASAWMVAAVMALQGICLIAIPAEFRQRVVTTMQAGVFLLLLVSIPFFVRLTGRTLSADTVMTAPQMFLPPIWFLGLEHWLLDGAGSGGYAGAAAIGGVAWAATVALIAVAFLRLFRSAETLAGTVGTRRPSILRIRLATWLRTQTVVAGPAAAVVGFSVRGLTRSRLHQFIFAIIIGCGLALLASQLATVAEGGGLVVMRAREARVAAIAAPLLIALCVTIGLRAAFLLPMDRGAGWVFRMVDDPATRPAALDGVALVFGAGALTPALIALVLLQPPLLGIATLPSAALTALAALGLIEFVLLSWRRIPYSCTYLPGKRHLTYTAAILLGAYGVFVATGANVVAWAVVHPSRIMFVGGMLLAIFAALRRARLRSWGLFPLEFEDDDPNAAIVMPLGPTS